MASDNDGCKDHLIIPDPQIGNEPKGYVIGSENTHQKPFCTPDSHSGPDSVDTTQAQTEICATDKLYASPSDQNIHSIDNCDAEMIPSFRLPTTASHQTIAVHDKQRPVTSDTANVGIAPSPLPNMLGGSLHVSCSPSHSSAFRDKGVCMDAPASTSTDSELAKATVSGLTLDAAASLHRESSGYVSTLVRLGRSEIPLTVVTEIADVPGHSHCSDEEDAPEDASLVEPLSSPSEIIVEAIEPQNLPNPYNDYDTDTDSALGDMSCASSMTSVTSSIYESVSENGRTYHSYKPGKYVLPNDLKEQGRLDTQHYMLCEAIGGKLFRAPLEPHRINRVLDIATGTGIWAMEFADDFPHAEVIGTDLTPIQPRWCPPNCRFEVDDAEDEWVYTSPFSYIHGRTLMTCFKDPRDVIFKCVQNLEQGGWLEFQDGQVPFEYEGSKAPPMVVPFSPDEPMNAMQKWEKLTLEASIRGERPWNNVKHYKRWFEEAGLVDVTEHRTKLPLGVWDGLTRREKRVGAMQFANMYHGLEGMTLRNFARLGWTFEESKALVEDVRKEMLSKEYRPCTFSVLVMGRKPYSGLSAE